MANDTQLGQQVMPQVTESGKVMITTAGAFLEALTKNADDLPIFSKGKMYDYVCTDHKPLYTVTVRNEEVEEFRKQCMEENIPYMNLHLSSLLNLTSFGVREQDKDRVFAIADRVHRKYPDLKLPHEQANKEFKGKETVKVDNLSYKEARILQNELAKHGARSVLAANQDLGVNGKPSYYVTLAAKGLNIYEGEYEAKHGDMDLLDKAMEMMLIKTTTSLGRYELRKIETEWDNEEKFAQLMKGELKDHVFFDSANPDNRIEISRLSDGNVCAKIKKNMNGKVRVVDEAVLDLKDRESRDKFERIVSLELKSYVSLTQVEKDKFDFMRGKPKLLYRAEIDNDKADSIDKMLYERERDLNNAVQIKMGFNTENHRVNFVNHDVNVGMFISEEMRADLKDVQIEERFESAIARMQQNLSGIQCTHEIYKAITLPEL